MPPAPAGPSERIGALDALRGLALLGVLAVNVVTEFRVSIFAQFLPPSHSESALDHAVAAFLTAAIELKALALFSFLFGVGIAIQHERLAEDGRRLSLLLRRLTVLLGIGFAHLLLIWNGDILTEYALAGFIALPFLWGPRWGLAAGAVAFLSLYLAMPLLPQVILWHTATWMAGHVAAATQVYGSGSFWDVLVFRVSEVLSILPLHGFIFPRTVGLFLLGALVWQLGVLRCPAEHARKLLTLAIMALVVGGGLTVAADAMTILDSLGPGRQTLERLAKIILASAYGAGVIGVASLWPTLVSWAEPLGRMAFTCYLAQSVIFGWIFYGYGLGLFGRLGVSAALAIGICVYLAQVVASAWWLQLYRFGPVEWLWRTLMYGERQVMRAG